uniref:phosphorylated CTD-interacting factor 1 n=1 Tax=Ciona intestinalis TaxID=7719 RepID=UPI000180BA34|nr:phosphorylated CTD-interacting factor 1 [Ciona intestinalis]|eukprot:XP_026692110.1 phosphorylated CTD-interacting factor 1 [Ciona intestinalis]
MDESHKPVEKFWNFNIETDVRVMQGAPCAAPPPTPEIEHYRANVTKKLREFYQDLCMSKEGIDAPNESFNRWIMERKVYDKGRDPMLPTACTDEVSPAMFREIMYDIPIRLSKIKSLSDARKQLFQYADAAKKMIEARPFTAEARKLVKWHVEETFSWLRKDQNALIDDYLNRLAHLRRQCGAYLAEAAKSSVEDICRTMYHMSQESSKKILDKHVEVLQLHNIEIPAALPPSGRLELIRPIVMPCETPKVAGITQEINKRHVCLTYNGELVRLNYLYLEKLEALYRISCKDDPKMELFLQRVWCLLRRYQTFFGPNQYEGIMLQGALPSTVFECLYSVFGVTMECFASPLNSYYKNYSSAFADTDCYFGSSGPLMKLFPVSGSFEVNPPFAEELMEAMVDHFEKLLAQSNEPLSFIVFVPEWRDPTPIAILRMETSKFKRKQVLVPAFEHEYRSGLQHVAPLKEVYHKAVHGTMVFFLQNESGFQKWGPTQDRLRKLLTAFRPDVRKQIYRTTE